MPRVDLQFEQDNHPPGNVIPRSISRQLHDHISQNATIFPAPDNRQLEGHELPMGPSRLSPLQKNEKGFSLLCTLKNILGYKRKMSKTKGLF